MDEKACKQTIDWAFGLDATIEQLKENVVEERDYASLSDSELSAFAKFAATIYLNAESLGTTKSEIEPALARCFTPLWMRACEGQGNPLIQFAGIKAIYDCRPAGLRSATETIGDFEEYLYDTLATMPDRSSMATVAMLEIATSAPLCQRIKTSTTYLDEWANDWARHGGWHGITLEEAFRRIKLLGAAGFAKIANEAFAHYADQVMQIAADGSLIVQPCSAVALSDMADAAQSVATLIPAHFIEYCVPRMADDNTPDADWWLLAKVVIQSYLRQKALIEALTANGESLKN